MNYKKELKMKNRLNLMITPGVMTLFMILGCGGENSANKDKPVSASTEIPTQIAQKGYLLDSALFGVTYRCDGKESLTNEDGLFECVTPPVSFNIGGLKLGTITVFTADTKVYPQDLLGLKRDDFADEHLKLLARLLQSLDDDGDIETTITIEPSLRDALMKEQNFTALSETDIDILLQKLEKPFVTEESALKHLRINSGFPDLNQVIVEEEINISLDLNGTKINKVSNRGIPFGSFFYFTIPSISTNSIIGDGPFNVRYFFDELEVSVKERIKVSIGEHNLSVIITEENGDNETATLTELFSVFQSASEPIPIPVPTTCDNIINICADEEGFPVEEA